MTESFWSVGTCGASRNRRKRSSFRGVDRLHRRQVLPDARDHVLPARGHEQRLRVAPRDRDVTRHG
jgi:hypothetical protein